MREHKKTAVGQYAAAVQQLLFNVLAKVSEAWNGL